MNSRANKNQTVMRMFHKEIDSGVMTLDFNRRDIIEGYMSGALATMPDLVEKLDLYSGFKGVKVEIFKENGNITYYKKTFLL